MYTYLDTEAGLSLWKDIWALSLGFVYSNLVQHRPCNMHSQQRSMTKSLHFLSWTPLAFDGYFGAVDNFVMLVVVHGLQLHLSRVQSLELCKWCSTDWSHGFRFSGFSCQPNLSLKENVRLEGQRLHQISFSLIQPYHTLGMLNQTPVWNQCINAQG